MSFAEVESRSDDDAPESQFFETATVRARPLSRATGSVSVIDRETIETMDVATVAELLRFVPGLDVESTGPRAGTSTAHIRGGESNYTFVLIDGVPLNDSTEQSGGGAVNLDSLSVAHVERIEIVRGPLSSSFGSTGLAGAINIITRRGETDSPDVTFGMAVGNNAVFLGSAGVSRASERRDYFIGAFWEQQEGAVNVADAGDRYRQWGVEGNGGTELGRSADLRVNGRYTRWEADDYPEVSGGPIFGSGELRNSDHEEFSLGLELQVGGEKRRHRVRATAYRHDLERLSPLIFNPANPPASVPRSIEDTTFTMWQLGWTAPQVRFGKSQLNYGIDGRYEDGKSDGAFPDVPLPQDYRIDRLTGGAFIEWIAEYGNVLIELSARLDVPEDFDEELNPRGGVSYRPGGGATRLHASLGRAFKLPSFYVLVVPIFGNPDLLPETSVGADAGIEHTFGKARLTFGLTAFYNRFQDLIDFDDTLFAFTNVPEVEVLGGELSIDWTPHKRLLVHANVTGQDFDDSTAGDPLTHRPEWVGGARVVWDITDRLRWNVDGQWVSEAFDFQVPLDGTFPVPGYRLFGTALTVAVQRGWDVQVRVDNLTDEEYQIFIGHPAPGRSFRIGVRLRSAPPA
jgi:outer membrane cobalamin receptor